MKYKNMVSVKVCGRTMTLTGNESVEYITKVANYIEEKAAALRESENSKSLSPTMVSVLTSINIADDYFKARDKSENLEKLLKDAGVENGGEKLKTAADAEKYLAKAQELEKKLNEINAVLLKKNAENEELKKENEELKRNSEALKASADNTKAELETLKNEKSTNDNTDLDKLQKELETTSAMLEEQTKKNAALQDDNIKKIAQINHYKSIESRLISFEKQEAERTQNNDSKSSVNKEITEETGDTADNDEESAALGNIPADSNKFRRTHTQNQNYYRHI